MLCVNGGHIFYITDLQQNNGTSGAPCTSLPKRSTYCGVLKNIDGSEGLRL